jgi:hypothetical protein
MGCCCCANEYGWSTISSTAHKTASTRGLVIKSLLCLRLCVV